mmetsp:Transcript_16496/g.45230  ORF Transcript_16496/g.45230 Transcript_16496/m.45230 type:complete len:355 (-) Transcript_16496:644-1708(-)|eukprot:CAMPEP_0202370946 /NCGR_PEP_ID=MMETSP1127-20130417/2449_1 /ASSEMBLY_ACC=CAM_ASM_000462 /TAXON_ID=3047 /ORGANISM="Dunaliella tertiolecta, Strain CCMP1320" /LENGTH=354 /DNA_ID=CAMNT_0048967025 /DNA_START=36 /DNA_END=1100 /DNA_ORIENTATION=-
MTSNLGTCHDLGSMDMEYDYRGEAIGDWGEAMEEGDLPNGFEAMLQDIGWASPFAPVPESLPRTPLHPSHMPPASSQAGSSEQLFENYPLFHMSAAALGDQAMPEQTEEGWPLNRQAFQRCQEEIEQLHRNYGGLKSRYDKLRDALSETDKGYQALQVVVLEQELRISQLSQQNNLSDPNRTPSWQQAQATLRIFLEDNDFTLSRDTLQVLVNQPIQAVHVCRALARMPSREKDVLLHHMEFVYGPSTGLYTSNTWNTWYKNMWRILRWVAAFAALSQITVEAAAQQIDALQARRNNNGGIIHFDAWRPQASARLAGLFLIAWDDSGASVNAGVPPRMVDRMEQLAQGCDVQVY